ncbi:MAG: hypothetical protein LC770_08190 [Acidobacteria bacterium]|nr:hypothetical protein [Acidobacteriota bacterium]
MNGMSASFLSMLVCFSILSSGIPLAAMAQQANNLSLDALTEGKNINGFRAETLYLNDADKAFGARFRHQRTGFTLDFLALQSVPQALMWVNSFPTSDRGEPHTQEHLLLGEGNTGARIRASRFGWSSIPIKTPSNLAG